MVMPSLRTALCLTTDDLMYVWCQARQRLNFVRREELDLGQLEPFWLTVAYGCPATDSWADARRRPQGALSVMRGIFAAASAMWVSDRRTTRHHDAQLKPQ